MKHFNTLPAHTSFGTEKACKILIQIQQEHTLPNFQVSVLLKRHTQYVSSLIVSIAKKNVHSGKYISIKKKKTQKQKAH